uniref:CAP-Gly domain-containing protein n=1 Tax=Tetraselmis chuii TaxID=63592 RepID=A0A7S1T1D1_9CHLO
MVSENGGEVSEGLASAVNVETVAEEMARKINVEDLNMDGLAQERPRNKEVQKQEPKRCASPTPEQSRFPYEAGLPSPGRTPRYIPSAAPSSRAESADSRTRHPRPRAPSRPTTPPREAWGNTDPPPAERSPRMRSSSPSPRPVTPPSRQAADNDRIFVHGKQPAPNSPRGAISASITAARCQNLESVVALASRLHSAGRLSELGYLLAATAAQGNVGGCVDPHTAAENAMTQVWHPPSARSSTFQLGDQVIVGNRRRLRGTIRYYGPTLFAEGDWVGMELDVAEGKNDGTVKGIHYFECKTNCGLFVKASILRAEE